MTKKDTTPTTASVVTNAIVNGTIHVGSVAVGAAAGVYVDSRDIMGDPESSRVAGAMVGVGVFALVNSFLMAVKNGTIRAGKAVMTTISGDSKKVAAGKVKKAKKSKKEED